MNVLVNVVLQVRVSSVRVVNDKPPGYMKLPLGMLGVMCPVLF